MFKPLDKDAREASNREARNFVIGYVGRKMGLKPRKTSNEWSWISLKGKGRLFEPSDELIAICESCDKVFDNFHGDGLRICKNPFNKLWKEILKGNPTYPVKVVNLYC